MNNQISLFDGAKKFKIDKPIRLITLFSGYDSQALSLKYLGVPFEHYKTSEWAVKSIQAMKDLHFCEDNTDYSAELTESEIKEWLVGRISSNYVDPLTETQIHRLSEKEVRKIYNNMKASRNLGSIMNIKGDDLNIVDTDKFTYLLTYLLTRSLVKIYLLPGKAQEWRKVAELVADCFGKLKDF